MARTRKYIPLGVYLNNRFVGRLIKQASGAISFTYDQSWLDWQHAIPVSLSMPLREESYSGEVVSAVFENLLPDSDILRRRVAERVGARGIDAYSLLTQIGRDCVGALQFIVDDDKIDTPEDVSKIKGRPVKEEEIEALLNNLVQAPLGLNPDDDFRISVAGAQEKTALLWHRGKWLKPFGTTPTTHIFKTQIGQLPNGIDMSNSVENEYYCLKLMEAFGLKVNKAEIQTFGEKKALVIERFDRRWTKDKRLLRLPQEDCCQALSVPPTLKYQNEGGPGITQVLNLLKGSDTPLEDQKTFLKAQIIFWLIGATDGHAKNFSIFLAPGGQFHLTPLYDVMTAQPSLDTRQIERKQMKMAVFVGNSRHYKFESIRGKHFEQTALKAGMSKKVIDECFLEIKEASEKAFESIEAQAPTDFPEHIHISVQMVTKKRLKSAWN